jgi:hypothetical protein
MGDRNASLSSASLAPPWPPEAEGREAPIAHDLTHLTTSDRSSGAFRTVTA